MNLIYGEIIDIFSEDDVLLGKVRVRGATKKIPLALLTDAARGDTVLICDGVAISKVAESGERKKYDVSGDSRETH